MSLNAMLLMYYGHQQLVTVTIKPRLHRNATQRDAKKRIRCERGLTVNCSMNHQARCMCTVGQEDV